MAARVSTQMNTRSTTSQAAPEKCLAPHAAWGRRCLLPRVVLQEQMLRSSPSLGLFWGMAQPPQKTFAALHCQLPLCALEKPSREGTAPRRKHDPRSGKRSDDFC